MRELGDRVEGVSRRDGLGHHARGLVRVGREILLEGEAGDEGLGLVEVDGRPLVDDDLLLARVLRGLLLLGLQLLELLGQACITSVPSQGRVVMAGDLLEVLVPTKARPLVVRDGVKQTYRALAREYFSLSLLQNGPEILAQNG